MSTEAEIILGAKATLAQACLDTGVRPTDEALFWLLGLVYGESRFGQTPDWTLPNANNTEANNPGAPDGPAHNWGAVRSFGNAPYIWHGDRGADGKPGMFKFARFTSQLEGAKHFLRTINRGDAAEVIGGRGTARDLSAAMFKNGYYTGTTGTPDERINAYANMILSGANRVKKALGQSGSSPLLPGPIFQPGTESGFPWVTALILGSIGVGGTVFLARKYDWDLLDIPSKITRRFAT